jgi:hypothetical protein
VTKRGYMDRSKQRVAAVENTVNRRKGKSRDKVKKKVKK